MNKRGRTKEDIFNVLKDRIVTLQYEPGKILNEIELSEEFGVSRTPIRTVFQQLESIKLVDIVPRYGVQVATLNFLNIKSLFEVTKVLDPLATKLAVSKLTDEVRDLRSEFVDVRSQLQRVRLESSVLKSLKDSGLKQSETPPNKIKVIVKQ